MAGVAFQNLEDALLDVQVGGAPCVLDLAEAGWQVVGGALAAGHDELVEGPGARVGVHGLLGVLGVGVHEAEGVDGAGATGRGVGMVRASQQIRVHPCLRAVAFEGEDGAPVGAAVGVPDGGVGGVGMVGDESVEAVVVALGGVDGLGAADLFCGFAEDGEGFP